MGKFQPESGLAMPAPKGGYASYTEVFGSTLCALAERDPSVVAITAAMPEGNGHGTASGSATRKRFSSTWASASSTP